MTAQVMLEVAAIAVLLDEAVERTVTTYGVDPVGHVKAEGRAEGLSEALGLLVGEDSSELRARALASILERRCSAAAAIAEAHRRLGECR